MFLQMTQMRLNGWKKEPAATSVIEARQIVTRTEAEEYAKAMTLEYLRTFFLTLTGRAWFGRARWEVASAHVIHSSAVSSYPFQSMHELIQESKVMRRKYIDSAILLAKVSGKTPVTFERSLINNLGLCALLLAKIPMINLDHIAVLMHSPARKKTSLNHNTSKPSKARLSPIESRPSSSHLCLQRLHPA